MTFDYEAYEESRDADKAGMYYRNQLENELDELLDRRDYLMDVAEHMGIVPEDLQAYRSNELLIQSTQTKLKALNS